MTGKQFMPVIHVLDMEQMLKNLEIAKSNGGDGVFLINHGSMSAKELVGVHAKAVETYPDFWIGINCLDLRSHEVFEKVPGTVDGIWVDDGGVYDDNVDYAKEIAESRARSSFEGKYFGGVAFKGGPFVKDAAKAAKVATEFIDMVTTSGVGTGIAAPIDKIASMKEAIGDKSLAIASGIDIRNVEEYLPYVDHFLVATGISRTFYELDPVKVKNLAEAIHGYSGGGGVDGSAAAAAAADNDNNGSQDIIQKAGTKRDAGDTDDDGAAAAAAVSTSGKPTKRDRK